MHDTALRRRKATTMVKVLAAYFEGNLGDLRLLNVGGSTGIIDNLLADHFGSVLGIDIDESAISYATKTFRKPNLSYKVDDAMSMNIPSDSMDVVICSQVYEHVPDAQLMMREIFRVLKQGGVCYFAASNRFMLMEPHYHLPFLSVIPRPLAHVYVRAFRKADYYHELHYSHSGLRKLVKDFEVVDFTKKIIENPASYEAEYMLPKHHAKTSIARLMSRYCYPLLPGYIWILKKT